MEKNSVIKTVRRLLNITQEQLAHDLSISFSTINRWENGKNAVSKLAKLRLIEYCKEKGLDDDIIAQLKDL